MGSCVVVLILECWHEDQMSAGSFKREGLDPIMHPSPLQVLSFSPWVLASCAEEEGLRRVSERHMLIGELRCSLNVVINSQSVETRNDMSQLEVVNNTLNSTSWYILYTHNLTWSLFALECSIAADANWFDWFSHRGFPPVNSRLRLKYGATIQRGGDWRFIGNEPHYKLKGEDWYKRRQLEIAIITQVNPYFTSAFSSSGGALKWIWGEIWSILSTTTL